MKITYPECQIELNVDEAIELLDYMERTSPKLVWQPTDETLDDFLEGFKRVRDEESQPAPVPYPMEEESTPVEIPKIPKTRKPYTTSKKVQVLFESGWKTYKNVAEAAKALEVNYKTLYHNLTIGKPCKKHQVC